MKFVATSSFWIAGKRIVRKGEVVSFEDEALISELRTAGRLADFGTEQAEKIQAEVIAEKKREKRDMKRMKEPWTRAHKLQVILAIASMLVAFWLALGRRDHQSHSTLAVPPQTNSVLQTNK
jgi:hypothetical protein